MKMVLCICLIALSGIAYSQDKDEFLIKRTDMVKHQLEGRGINDRLTLDAMLKVPRHLFVPAEFLQMAYNDSPLPIGYGQTISQPYIVAFMTGTVKPSKGKKALEIGTGSGYQAAILAEIVDFVYSVEIVPELAAEAAERLKKLNYNNVIVKQGDGYKGWLEFAPFDIIIVTAACDHVPQPLIDQLAEGGRLVMPVGKQNQVQELVLITKKKGKTTYENLLPVRFVPFTREKN